MDYYEKQRIKHIREIELWWNWVAKPVFLVGAIWFVSLGIVEVFYVLSKLWNVL